MKSSARLTCVITLAAILAAPVSALAQSADNKVQAEALFEEGRQLMSQQHYDEACKKLEGSQKLDPGAGTLLNLAACYEKNGQIASAWVTYKDAAAASAGRHQDWVDQSNAKAAELEPKLSHLTIVVSQNLSNLAITRDGAVVSSPSLGAAIPIDAGPHTIEAHAPGYKPFTTKITIGASQDSQTVTVPALEVDTTSAASPRSGGGSQKILGGALAGAGAVGLVVGSIFGVVALGKKSSANNPKLCNSDLTVCNAEGTSDVNAARSDGIVSTVTLIGGGVFVAAGAVIFLTAPGAENKPDGATIQARLGAPGSPAGFSLGGSF
jgi:hypothetical protein